ncbi:transcriptional regulator, partial [Enterobacter bugandensis]|nr:transcriptional regulator [Enterobacter bugandensis]
LTPEGEALLADCQPVGNEVDEAFLGRLNKAEREQFSALIKKMMHD